MYFLKYHKRETRPLVPMVYHPSGKSFLHRNKRVHLCYNPPGCVKNQQDMGTGRITRQVCLFAIIEVASDQMSDLFIQDDRRGAVTVQYFCNAANPFADMHG